MIDDPCHPHQGAPVPPCGGDHDHHDQILPQPYDSMTKAEYIALIVKLYDVPMDLIRYDTVEVTKT